jgi:hypothetical protein
LKECSLEESFLSDISRVERVVICPNCGTVNVDFGKGVSTCSRCGYNLEATTTKETESFSSTTQPQAILAEETKRSATLITLPHKHEEFAQIAELSKDVIILKKDLVEVKKILLETKKPSVEVRVLETRETTLEEARPLVKDFVEEFLKSHEEVYPSDIADELELEYEVVKKIFDELEKEGKLKKKEE